MTTPRERDAARTLPDEAARARIRDDLDHTLFVEAAAGTGKTTALVGRIVSLVAEARASLPSVAAITFTEKAAAELRDRLRRELATRADQFDRAGDPTRADRCRRGLEQLDDAAVTTLHSFAQGILAEYPLEVGMPPRLDILDDVRARTDFDESWERFAAELTDEAPDELRTALLLGLELRHLRDLAWAMYEHWDRLEEHPVPAAEPPAVQVTGVIRSLEAAIRLLGGCADHDDTLARHVADRAGYVDRLRQVTGDTEVLAALADAPPLAPRKDLGRAEAWGGKDTKAAVHRHLNDAQDERDGIVDGVRRAVLTRLADRVREFTLDDADRRRRAGTLGFHDLLVQARRLLRSRSDVRRELHTRWQRIFIDEFQDTDPLQIELGVLLATGEEQVGARGWWEVDVAPGRLFMVGDPKQSIYRFRRADIALYQRVAERFAEGHVVLDTSFRCADPITRWVDSVFSSLMGDGAPGLQPAYTPLRAVRRSVAPSVSSLGGKIDEPAAVVRDQQAEDIATTIRRASEEQWIVHDDGDDTGRPVRYGDIAVLIPTRLVLPHLERALATDEIPFRVESRSLLWTTQEVRDLLAVLRAIEDSTDEVALVATLRSPVFACTDDALVEFRRAGGAWDHQIDPPSALAPDHPVVTALSRLATHHAGRHWEPTHRLVERVVRELRFLELQVGHPRPRDHWRRLRFVVDQARAFDESGGATLREFVDWAEEQARAQVGVNDAIIPEADDDAVRIMTVHAAKGLEFPVVFLAGLDSGTRADRPPILFDDDGTYEISVGAKHLGFRTEHYDRRQSAESGAETHEDRRLLYVAATRARDHLVVCLHHSPSARTSRAGKLAELCPPDAPLWCEPAAGRPASLDPRPPQLVEPPERAGWLEQRTAWLEAAARPPAVAATSLADAERERDEDAREPWRRGRAGTSIGRAVHAVLQTIDLATGDLLDETAQAQAAAEGIPDRVADVRRAARTALQAQIVQDAVATGRFWRELYVAAPVEGTVVEGFIDLLVDTDAGLVVVDYKTDAADPHHLDSAADRYRLQIAAYATALETTLRRPVTRGVLVFVGEGRPREVDIPDLAGAVAEIHRRVRG